MGTHTGIPSDLKVCVVIPTYNNHLTLRRVIESVLIYTEEIIVINDGSTDSTSSILSQYPKIVQIHFPKNLGKGMALRTGLAKAEEWGYHYAITIDSDGQHFASDIPVFINGLTEYGDAIYIGSRNMAQAGVPKKSSFGNRFSNFWFWFETGIRLDDTQSGYRLYPLKLIPEQFCTKKFEFEIEVIVRSAWKGVPVHNIPIQILYDPTERVSHFRPFRDFTRISILNTVLVVIALVYIKPRDLVRKLKKKGIRKFLLEDVLGSDDSNAVKAMSAALGIFVGIAPFWGFQTIIVLFLAALLRLNKAIAFTFSNISIPPMIPLVIYGSLVMGSFFIPQAGSVIPASFSIDDISKNLIQYIVGSFALATLAALVVGLTGYFVLQLFTIFRSKS